MKLAVRDEERGLELCIEDDGKAAYAFVQDLAPTPTTLAGVWLYNHAKPVAISDPAVNDLPRNRPEWIVDERFEPISSAEDVSVTFGGEPGLGAYVEVYLRDQFHAYMEARARTGWCVLAKRGSRLAKPLRITPLGDGIDDVKLLDYEVDY